MTTGEPIPAPVPVRSAPHEQVGEPPLYKRAPLTFAIIAVNLAVFAGQVAMGGLRSLVGMPSWVLLAFGGNSVGATLYEQRYETLLTSCFVHGSLLHIAFNMVALRQIGPFVERTVGASRMAPLYILTGLGGSTGSTFFGWLSQAQRLSVGASGAICGLIGAALVVGYRVEGPRSSLMRAMAGWLATILALGLAVSFLINLNGHASQSFDNAAHAGGALAGVSIAITWRRGEAPSSAVKTLTLALCTGLLVGTGVRVARFSLSDPFALLTAPDRLALAARWIDAGNCRDAAAAITSVKHLMAPDAPEVRLIERNYWSRCR